MTTKYNLKLSSLQLTTKCNTKGYVKHRGWRVLTGLPETFIPRKPDKRTNS